MDKNDYSGSFAQENVLFSTQVVRTASVGDNYWKVMIFVENNRYVATTDASWILIPGSTTVKALTVTAADYTIYTKGQLQAWLLDLFANGFTGDCILVACGDKLADTAAATAFNDAMAAAYEIMKPYAYHKTACVTTDDAIVADAVEPTVAVKLAQLCKADKGLLSGAPYFPCTNTDLTQDALYTALANDATADAFMAYHYDTTHNTALFSLGTALSVLNGSGTSVGNQFDMVATGNITASGEGGTNLPVSVKSVLSNANIQYYKTVGDNTGNVAAVGALSIKGDVISATWITSYVTYMSKVRIAELITTRGFYKNAASYTQILNVLTNILSNAAASGRLANLSITAPGYDNLPDAAGDEIVIPNAWEATYVDVVRKVTISGTLYIGA